MKRLHLALTVCVLVS